MKVETKDLEDRQVEMTVEVPADQLQAAMESAARRLSKRVKIPGFRPGKAPYAIVVRKLGHEQVFEEALDSLGQEIYRSALDDTQLEPFAPGSLEEVVSQDPLVLRYTVPLAPEIELGAYRELRIEHSGHEVDDQAVEEVMDELRQGQALIEPVDRPAELGDVVALDVHGELLDDEAEAENRLLEEKNVSVLVEEDTDWPVPGVVEHLKGMQTGDEKTFEYMFPEDYRSEDLRGKTGEFHLNCLEVKSRIVPDWSDNLAQNLGDFESLLDLRMKVRAQLEEQATQQADSEFAQEVIDKVVEAAEVRYPPRLLEDEIDDMIHDLGHQLERRKLTLDEYLKVENQTLDQLRDDLKPQAEKRLKRALVLGKVVELESLEVEASEIDKALDNIVQPFGERATELKTQLDNASTRRSLRLDLLSDKAVERLVGIARGETFEAPAADDDSSSDEDTSVQAEEAESEKVDAPDQPEASSDDQ